MGSREKTVPIADITTFHPVNKKPVSPCPYAESVFRLIQYYTSGGKWEMDKKLPTEE